MSGIFATLEGKGICVQVVQDDGTITSQWDDTGREDPWAVAAEAAWFASLFTPEFRARSEALKSWNIKAWKAQEDAICDRIYRKDTRHFEGRL